MSVNSQSQLILVDLFAVALQAVNGKNVVEKQLLESPLEGDVAVVAVGKAATSMMSAAQNILNDQIQSALIITKKDYGHESFIWPCIEAGHPIPDEKSLEAGQQLLNFLSSIPENTQLLVLISGGASALVEVLPDKMTLQDLQKMNQWLLSSGLDIHNMNRIRQSVSLIKGGKALQILSDNKVTQLAISDVRYDNPEIIGSGLFVNPKNNKQLPVNTPQWLEPYIQPQSDQDKNVKVEVKTHIVANNELACQAVINKAKQDRYEVFYHGQSLYGDVFKIAEKIAEDLKQAQSGIHIWGGEPTIELPKNQGRGGRNQSLALAIACEIENSKELTVLVGATDGTDGATDDAGAIVDGQTLQRGGTLEQAKEYLQKADAGSFLAEAESLLSTGPTGTNVMDLVIALKL